MLQHLELGFLGFGLIGGSIARSLKSSHQDVTIHVYTRRKNSDLEQGVSDGIIDELHYHIDHSFASCDIIFLCAPVLTNIDFLSELKPIIKPSCILTDVGSVKGNIHRAVADLNMDSYFIGGHPMAGSEKVGYASSSTSLLVNAFYLLTPTEKTDPKNLSLLKELVETIGSVCIVLDAEQHDNITAAISHVPHIIASSLVQLVRQSDDDSENMKHFAAGGFKDITRIASSSPEMWQNICLSNQASIQHFIQEFCKLLENFSTLLTAKDENKIQDFFETAREYRDSILTTQTSILSRFYEVFVDIPDQAGAIATIATILADASISIKNIGIINNREFADGVLRIEFDDEIKAITAQECLASKGYQLFKR